MAKLAFVVFLLASVMLLLFSMSCNNNNNIVTGYRIYALSNTLDVYSTGSWKTISANDTYFFPVDKNQLAAYNGNLFIHAGVGYNASQQTHTQCVMKHFVDTNVAIRNDNLYTRFAFDNNDNLYVTDSHQPIFDGSPVSTSYKWFANANTETFSENYLPPIMGNTASNRGPEIASFAQGTALIFAGSFGFIGDGPSHSVDAYNVAFWNLTTHKAEVMGSNNPGAVSRVVTNQDGSSAVLLTGTSTIWRWNKVAKLWVRHDLAITSSHGNPYISDLAFGNSKLFVIGNFDTMNGQTVRNVSLIAFGPNNSLNVTGIGFGLPGGTPLVVYPRSDTQIFIGGSTKGKKVVYEWRRDRATPWSRIGTLGFTPGASPAMDSTPVFGLTVV